MHGYAGVSVLIVLNIVAVILESVSRYYGFRDCIGPLTMRAESVNRSLSTMHD
eukprot:COSAG05_NODE_500_length_9234_cov_107.281664_20_plen_53_part_00